MKWETKVTNVDKNGEIIPNYLLENYNYKIEEQHKVIKINHEKSKGFITITRLITIHGRKSKQLTLF